MFLRPWADDRREVDGVTQYDVLWNEVADDPRPGHKERKRHGALIRSGYSAFGVLCERKSPGRGISRFESRKVLRISGVVDTPRGDNCPVSFGFS